MTSPTIILNELLTEYSDNIQNSPTLISISNCRIHGLSPDFNAILAGTNLSLLKSYLKSCIDNEIKLGGEYFIFYTAQSFGKYISSRVLDYLINELEETPSYKFYIGIQDRDQSNYNVGGKYPNMKEYMKFVNNFFENKIREINENFESTVLQLKIKWSDMMGMPLEAMTPQYLQDNQVDIREWGFTPILGRPELSVGESFDGRGTEFSKNMYSLNNTALGNSFGTQSTGESTLKFLLTKYSQVFNAKSTMKFLKQDILNITKHIDGEKLDIILNEFSDNIQKFYNEFIGSADSKYLTKNGIVFQIAVKKNQIYKYIIPTVGYAVPLISKYREGDYDGKFKDRINNYFNQINTYPNDIANIRSAVNELLEGSDNMISEFVRRDLQNDCDYYTAIQSRAIITGEWIKNLLDDNGDIKINVFPCNYDDEKPDCSHFVGNVDSIIKTLVDEIKLNIRAIPKSKIQTLKDDIVKGANDIVLTSDNELLTKEEAMVDIEKIKNLKKLVDNKIELTTKDLEKEKILKDSFYNKKYLKYKAKYLELKKNL